VAKRPSRSMVASLPLAVADQAVSSATNIVAVIAAAPLMSAADFGRFSVLYAVFTVSLGVGRALVCTPLTLSDEPRRTFIPGILVLLGVGVLAAAIFSGIGIWFADGDSLVAVLGGLALATVLPLDLCRALMTREQRPAIALVYDLTWLALLLFALWGLRTSGTRLDPTQWSGILFVTGILPAAAFAPTVQQLIRARPRGAEFRLHLTKIRNIGARLTVEYLALSAAAQTILILSASLLSLAFAGGLRATYTLYGGVNVLALALVGGALPTMKVLAERGREKSAFGLASGLAATLVIGVALLTVLLMSPVRAGVTSLLGETGTAALALVLPIGIRYGFTSIYITSSAFLKAIGAVRVATGITITWSLTTAVLAFPILAMFGTSGAIGLLVGGEAVAAIALLAVACVARGRLSSTSRRRLILDNPTAAPLRITGRE
jgi:O-antigen/teichoic acid export membrane protein